MKAIVGGSAVQGGYYVSRSNWEVFPVARDGDRLPGPASEHYVKVPTAVAFLLMPVLGGVMVVFLPFIGLFLAAKTALRPVGRLFARSSQDLAATVTPGWAPGAAHFTGKSAKADAVPDTAEARLERLAREIDALRRK